MHNIHEELILPLMLINDVESKKGLKFDIKHPQKSFTVSAPNGELKRSWMEAVRTGIDACVERKQRAEEYRQQSREEGLAAAAEGTPGGRSEGEGAAASAGDWSEISTLTEGIEIDANGLGRITSTSTSFGTSFTSFNGDGGGGGKKTTGEEEEEEEEEDHGDRAVEGGGGGGGGTKKEEVSVTLDQEEEINAAFN